jgi:hypothetical protein
LGWFVQVPVMIGQAENTPPSGEGDAAPVTDTREQPDSKPREVGGRDGPEPTRYGDWEKNGRCIDF